MLPNLEITDNVALAINLSDSSSLNSVTWYASVVREPFQALMSLNESLSIATLEMACYYFIHAGTALLSIQKLFLIPEEDKLSDNLREGKESVAKVNSINSRDIFFTQKYESVYSLTPMFPCYTRANDQQTITRMLKQH